MSPMAACFSGWTMMFGRVLVDTNPGFQPVFLRAACTTRTPGSRFGACDYDAVTGRWTAKDPIGFAGGNTNLHAYVGGDPVNRNDPTGLWSFPWSDTPGMSFDLPFGPNREEHSGRNRSNRCHSREPSDRNASDHSSPNMCGAREGSYDEGFFGGKWRYDDGSECYNGPSGDFAEGGGTFNFFPYPYGDGPLEKLGNLAGHGWSDFGAHYWYGGEEGSRRSTRRTPASRVRSAIWRAACTTMAPNAHGGSLDSVSSKRSCDSMTRFLGKGLDSMSSWRTPKKSLAARARRQQ